MHQLNADFLFTGVCARNMRQLQTIPTRSSVLLSLDGRCILTSQIISVWFYVEWATCCSGQFCRQWILSLQKLPDQELHLAILNIGSLSIFSLSFTVL